MSELGFAFWGSIVGFAMITLAALSLLVIERRRLALQARLSRLTVPAARSYMPSRPPVHSVSAGLYAWLHNLAAITVERVSIMGGGEAAKSADLLRTAGFRGREAQVIFAFIKTVLPLLSLAVCLLWFLLLAPSDLSWFGGMVIITGIGLVVSKTPDLVLANRRSRRLGQIRKGFPDMLELLVITSEAGLGPQQAMSRVAWEMRTTQPILSGELGQLVTELGMTGDRAAAYRNLGDRVPLPEISIFTQTLAQSETYGTSFAKAMRTLIRDQRADRLLRVEEKAARLPALMTVPLIFFIMPAIFVVLVGPAALTIADNIMGAF